MEKRINKTELLQFLNGKTSPEESIVINQFLQTTVGQNLLEELLKEHWELAGRADVDQTKLSAWKKEWSLKFDGEPEVLTKTRRLNVSLILRHAAVWTILILGIGIYAISNRTKKSSGTDSAQLVQKTQAGSHSRFALADGTQVYLGPGSMLSYPATFSGKTRPVTLQGEAYFEVTKNKEKPFLIYTENLRTQVLGTTFKVSSFKDSPILVSVTSGKVKVDRITGEYIQELAILNPGEQVSYSKQSEVLKTKFNIDEVRNWKQGQLAFDGTPLSELANQIGRWYNVSIVINSESLKKIPITVTLDGNMPIYKFLDGLSVSFGFHYKVKDRTITIY